MAFKVRINQGQVQRKVRTVGIGTPSSFSGLSDVDASDADDEEVPVWDEALNKFVVKRIPRVNGGEF